MTLLQAIIMGIIQGMTEFLPVSSSGHLALFKIMFNVNTDTGLLYDVMLHFATLIAICIAFYHDIFELVREGFAILFTWFRNLIIFFKNRFGGGSWEPYEKVVTNSYRKFVILILVATVPTGILGVVGSDFVEAASLTLLVPGICLIVTAILLFIADRCEGGSKGPAKTSYLNAFEIGMVQGLATLPGLSRSGSTMTACLLCGFDKKFAVRFSFIMSIPAVLGAALLQLKDIGDYKIPTGEVPYYIVGMIVACIVGYACIKTMLIVIRKRKFTYFAIYCLIVGVVSLGGYFLAGK